MFIKSALIVAITAASVGGALVAQLPTDPAASPGATAIAVAPIPTPTITSVGPRDAKAAKAFKGFRASPAVQVLPVSGDGFQQGLVATLTAPLGLSTTFPASAIADLTPTSFTLGVTFDEPGTYLLTVRNRGSARSNALAIAVKR